MSAVLLVYSSGNNCGNYHFIWHVPDNSLDNALKNSHVVIKDIKTKLPVFHPRIMKREFINNFGEVCSTIKPAVLRYFYQDLTGDTSSSETTDQRELDYRVKQAIEMEDPEIITDLRQLNSGAKAMYDAFWDECGKCLEQNVRSAVDDRRHGDVTHIATAISVCDLRDQVAAKCPTDTPVPSVEWLRLQFWPKTLTAKAALHHTGCFEV